MRLENAGHAGLAAQVHAFVGQHGHDARWRHRGEARLVGHAQQRSSLGRAQGMAGRGAHSLRSAIARREAFPSVPTLQRARIDARDLAGRLQPRPVLRAASMSWASAWRFSRPIIRFSPLVVDRRDFF